MYTKLTLGPGTDPVAVSKHLAKLFDNMAKLEFEMDKDENPTKVAVGMYSKESELVC